MLGLRLAIRALKALAQHSLAYDGFGVAAVGGDFATIGSAEVAEMLDKNEMMMPIIELALRSDEHRDVRRSMSALEECFAVLEDEQDALRTGGGLSMQRVSKEPVKPKNDCRWGGLALWRGDPDREQLNETREVQFQNFPTYRASAPCNLEQRGYYEIEVLNSLRAPQFGFVSASFEGYEQYTGEGVGDDSNSWGIDGDRQKLWHDGPRDGYTGTWRKGDVIGLACDLKTGQVREW